METTIDIQRGNGEEWLVTVRAATTTRHRVRVAQTDLDRLAKGQSAEALLRESFLFLLEREPNTSILASFDISLIGHYFPEYEQEISARFARGR